MGKSTLMGIDHNSHFDGAVQSLGAKSQLVRTGFNVGVVNPGKWSFGVAERGEQIRVLAGGLKINGKLIHSHGPCAVIDIKKGEQILVEADDFVPYWCLYDSE